MTTNSKAIVMKGMLACIAAIVIALALLVPGVLVYKLAHGASGFSCATILAAYAASWVVLLLLVTRFRERSAVWGILFGICFYGLLFWSWRL